MQLKLVTFRIHTERYALPLDDVQSIERLQSIRPVPHAQKHILGIMNLRGVVRTVADLRSMLSLPLDPFTDDTRLLLVGTTGYIIDEALDVIEVDSDQIEVRDDDSVLTLGVMQHGPDLIAVLQQEALLISESG